MMGAVPGRGKGSRRQQSGCLLYIVIAALLGVAMINASGSAETAELAEGDRGVCAIEAVGDRGGARW